MTNQEIYDSFCELTSFSFPLDFKKSFSNEIKAIIEEYNTKVKTSFLLNENIKDKIINFGNGLFSAYMLYKNNKMEAFDLFNSLMNNNKKCLPFAYLGKKELNFNIIEHYFRIRINEPIDNKAMLHRPFFKNDSIKNRYECSKCAVSYMSTSLALSWYECNKPDDFYVAEYCSNDFTKKLLRIDINPVSAHNDIRRMLCDKIDVFETLEKYCFAFPLVAFCSVIKNDLHNDDEYIIPKLLMDWVFNNDEYIGIRYYSDNNNVFAHNKGEHNIALLAKNPDSDGYSIDLQKLFIENCNQIPVKRIVMSNLLNGLSCK